MFARHRAVAIAPPVVTDLYEFLIDNGDFDWSLGPRLGFTPANPITVIIRVVAGVIVQGLSTGTYAMDLDANLPAGSTVRLYNNGYILGMGGDGGDGTSINGDGVAWYGHAGRAGGSALRGPGAGITCEVHNGAGRILAGGGGGGGGGASSAHAIDTYARGGGGGGGAGGGEGGRSGENTNTSEFASPNPAGDGVNGTTGVDGTFGSGGAPSQRNSAQGGAGGAGGDWGQAGTDGTASTAFAEKVVRTLGGAAGKAIELNSGTVTIVSGGSSPNIMGAVS